MESALRTDFVRLLQQRAQEDPDRPAFTFLEGEVEVADTLTYGELHRRAAALAGELRTLLAPGDRALLLHPAGLDYVVAFYACLYARVVGVPLYVPQRRTVPTIEAVAEDCGAAAVLTTGRTLSRRSLFAAGSRPARVPWRATDGERDVVRDARAVDAAGPGAGAARESRMEAAGEAPGAEGVTPDTLAYLQYTSGSTSTPKGVMVTHGNAVAQCAEAAASWRVDRGSRWVSWLPHFHDYGQIGSVLLPVSAGAHSVLMAPATFVRRPVRWLRALSEFRGTHTGAPNFAYDLCVESTDDAARAGLDLGALLVAGNGAEPVHADTLDAFQRTFAPYGLRPGVLCPSYGMAETTLKVTNTTAGAPYTRGTFAPITPGAPVVPSADARVRPLVGCGTTVGETRVAVVEPKTGHRLPAGHAGEIWVSGPIVCAGYWNRPEESAATFRALIKGEDSGPHLRTGDLGFVREGQLHICGRIKDVVIVNGVNHYPQDIERTAENSHPALRRGHTAAFGVTSGARETVVVVTECARQDGTPPADVAREVREAVWRLHDLTATVVVTETGAVPVTTSGKVQRGRCKRDFEAGALPERARLDAAPGTGPVSGAGPAPASGSMPVHDPVRASAPPPPREPAAEPAPPSAADAVRQACRGRITGWISAKVLEGAEVDSGQALAAYGLTSLHMLELHTVLEEWSGAALPPELLWESASIDELAGQVAGRLAPAAGTGAGR